MPPIKHFIAVLYDRTAVHFEPEYSNSGLSYGLNRALEKVKTPYVMRMDDDELLTLKTCLGDQVLFLEHHPEIDLVAFCTLTAIRCKNPDEEVSRFTSFSMQGAPKPLRIPHMTQIDGNHFVMGKVPNLYVARTEKIRSIGWDEKIRMMDHQDFFLESSWESCVCNRAWNSSISLS